MGPYCNYCGSRCFEPIPIGTPGHILKAYGFSTIVATCKAGQEFEKNRIGYCYDDILQILSREENPPKRSDVEA
jgi:hypothetical protein